MCSSIGDGCQRATPKLRFLHPTHGFEIYGDRFSYPWPACPIHQSGVSASGAEHLQGRTGAAKPPPVVVRSIIASGLPSDALNDTSNDSVTE